MKALTIKQPYAWAIAHGGKTVENRSWITHYRGPLAIHAGASWYADGAWDRRVIDAAQADQAEDGTYDPPLSVEWDTSTGRIFRVLSRDARYVRSAIVAVADLTGCCGCDGSCSPWAEPGQRHFLLANIRPLVEPVAASGAQGLWPVEGRLLEQVTAQFGEVAN